MSKSTTTQAIKADLEFEKVQLRVLLNLLIEDLEYMRSRLNQGEYIYADSASGVYEKYQKALGKVSALQKLISEGSP